MSSIEFVAEEIDFELSNADLARAWIDGVIKSHACSTGDICYIFCSDSYLLKINQEHLKHDTYTDIITFDYVEDKLISGDLFISIDRIRENATLHATTFENELHRVMIHGVLHLLGFGDKTKADQTVMTQQENNSLSLRSF